MRFCAFTLISAIILSFTPPVEAARTRSYVTRAEAIMLLLSNRKESVPERLNHGKYPDLLDGQWYVKYMLAAVDKELIDEDPQYGLLYPHRHVTRAEFLKMMTSAYSLPTKLAHSYEDVAKDAWYDAYAGLADRYEIFLEEESNELHPQRPLTHREAVQAVHAIFIGFDDMLTTAHAGLRPAFQVPTYGEDIEQTPPTPPSPQSLITKAVQKKAPLSNPAGPVTTVSAVRKAMLKLFRKKDASPEVTKLDLIKAVNEVRKEHGRKPLGNNVTLEAAAQGHARDMAKRGYFSHFTPEGKSYVDRIRHAKYMEVRPGSCSCNTTFQLNKHVDLDETASGPVALSIKPEECGCKPLFAVGENIAKGQLTVKQVMNDWMNSPPHRKNILREEFEEIGIGIFDDVWGQNFGRIRFKNTN